MIDRCPKCNKRSERFGTGTYASQDPTFCCPFCGFKGGKNTVVETKKFKTAEQKEVEKFEINKGEEHDKSRFKETPARSKQPGREKIKQSKKAEHSKERAKRDKEQSKNTQERVQGD